jgi:hypothetical protein
VGILDGFAEPFMVGAIKVWPCASRPGFQWFIAFEGKPYYFRGKSEATLFARDRQSMNDSEGLCD